MNGITQDAWFYTREGERVGPVTLADLRIKVSEASLHPRMDMVWTQGMAEWKPAGEIEGLFERRSAPEPADSPAPPADPYSPPKQQSVEETMSREDGWPGARRRSFLFATIVFPAVWGVLFPIGSGLLAGALGPEIMRYLVIAAAFVPALVAIYFGLMRLVNLGMSRWWLLGNFVPVLNLWVGYRTFACPAGYGYHKKLDGPGWFLAILYWLLVVLIVLATIAVIAMLIGAVGDPALQQQLRDAIRTVGERALKP